MTLFSNSDIQKLTETAERDPDHTMSRACEFPLQSTTLNSFSSLQEHLPSICPGQVHVFYSDGSWSNYELMEYLLERSGPALVGFTTWSISEVAITRMNDWLASGRIIDLHCVLDNGLRNRKPHIYQQAAATLKNLKLSHCHAKVMAIVAPEISFLVIGSANFTKNPRKEAGVIICDRSEADSALQWIKGIIDGGDS